MRFAFTYRAGLLALAAMVALPQMAMSIIIVPFCSDDAGLDLYNVRAMSGGMTLATGSDTQGRILILAACDGETQLVIQSGDDAFAHQIAVEGVTLAIASAEVLTFEDLRDQYDYGSFLSALPLLRQSFAPA